MPAVPARVLIQAIIDAAAEADASAILISSPSQQPRRFAITTADGDSFNLNAYLWTLVDTKEFSTVCHIQLAITIVRSASAVNGSPTLDERDLVIDIAGCGLRKVQ